MSKTIKLKRYKCSAQSILANSKSCMALSKGVYSKYDYGKLTSKDANNTRRSKQNTYHVVNKNIAPSKVTDERRRKRGCLPGHPQALTFWCTCIILGMPWESPSLVSCHSLFHNPSKEFTQNLKTSQHKTQQKSRELRQ